MLDEYKPDDVSGQESVLSIVVPPPISGVAGLRPLDVRAQLHMNGWSPLPIHSRLIADAGKAGKAPNLLGWAKQYCQFGAAPPTPQEVGRWNLNATRAPGTGIACGNVVGIDLDFVHHVDVAEEAHALAVRIFGPTPLIRIGQHPKRLLVYRAGEPIEAVSRKAADSSGDGLDVLASGRQFVAFGLHAKTGLPYRWGAASPLTVTPDAAPAITRAQVETFLSEMGRLIELNSTGGRLGRAGGGGGSAQVTRDPVSGLVTDGRESYLYRLIWQAACAINDANDPITVEAVTARAWARFAETADPSDGKWSHAAAEVKAGELVERLRRGAKALPARVVASPPTYPDRRVSLAEAEATVSRVISEFFTGPVEAFRSARAEHEAATAAAKVTESEPPADLIPPCWAARIETAVGKTERAINAAVEAHKRGLATVLAVPSHRLGGELVERIRRAGAEARAYRGYGAPDPDLPDHAMCQNLDAYNDAREAGVSHVAAAICERTVDGLTLQCPRFDVCGMQRQRAAKPAIWIVPHALLFRQRPSYIRQVDALVIDEGFVLGALPDKPSAFGLDAMAAADCMVSAGLGQDYTASNDLEQARADLMRALRAHDGDGYLRRDLLDQHGITTAVAGSASALEWRRRLDPEITPGMLPTSRKALVARVGKHNAEVRRWAAVWGALRVFLSSDEAVCGRMWLRLDADTEARKLEWRSPAQIRPTWLAPVLAIDATLPDPALLQTVIGHPVELRADIAVTWSPHGVVRQVTGAPVSDSKLGIIPGREREAEPAVIGDLMRLVRLRAALAWPHIVAVIGPLRLIDKLRAAGLPENVETGNYNGVAGLDRWREAAGLVCIGRPLPGPREVEGMAAAFTGRVPEAIPADASGRFWYARTPGAIRLATGEGHAVERPQHPDPIAEAIRQQITESNLVQAIGRLRAQRRTADHRYFVDLIGDIVLPLSVDVVETWEAAQIGPWAELAAEGVLLASAGDVLRAYPSLASSRKRARALADQSRVARTLLEIFPKGVRATLRRIEFKRAGRHAPGSAIILPNGPADPRAWLEARLGPLASYSLSDLTDRADARP